MNTTKKQLLWTRRKMLARVASGAAAGLALAACGGGGGGDDSSGNAQALREAFPKLRERMTTADVEAMVGFPPNNQRTLITLEWVVGDVKLNVGFRSTDTRFISSATLTDGRTPSQTRQFEE
jgi:hypothetical protein